MARRRSTSKEVASSSCCWSHASSPPLTSMRPSCKLATPVRAAPAAASSSPRESSDARPCATRASTAQRASSNCVSRLLIKARWLSRSQASAACSASSPESNRRSSSKSAESSPCRPRSACLASTHAAPWMAARKRTQASSHSLSTCWPNPSSARLASVSNIARARSAATAAAMFLPLPTARRRYAWWRHQAPKAARSMRERTSSSTAVATWWKRVRCRVQCNHQASTC
mmetsp:Transcript_125577/g.242111  ORF Transcript_125577/g.242111 Transcript_125577/m.242111 type:complete len:229 (-) Transcript_125577:49-735(-)